MATSNFEFGKVNSDISQLNDHISNLGPYNGLDSTNTTAALSAAQGKVLRDSLKQTPFLPSFLHANAQTSDIHFYTVPLNRNTLVILTGLLTLTDSINSFTTIFSCPTGLNPPNPVRFPVSKNDQTLFNGTFNGDLYFNTQATAGNYYISCTYFAVN